MQPALDSLPRVQRTFWENYASSIPEGWVLYGGTAIALRLGHRQSVDFDFFTHDALDESILRDRLPLLESSRVLQRQPNTLVSLVSIDSEELQLSFFGHIRFGRTADPDIMPNGVELASPLDLLATKLKVILQRVEMKDYVDIEALLRTGLSLSDGLRAASALFKNQLNPMDSVKAVAWFKDGDLERKLSAETKRFLRAATKQLDPAALAPLPLLSAKLSRRA